jgi:Coproporphyrinogen III oxidase and related Fe-S oxidoreductases
MREARAAGYANVNLDLIYGADGERIESWERTLRETVDLAPEHVSAYALTIEPSTPLGRKVQHGAVPPPDPDLQADMFELACEVLGDAGYQHYEVSNWAKPGFACVHNLGYWERGRTSGSAPARIRTATTGAGGTCVRPRSTCRSSRPGRCPVGGEERLEPSDAYLEEVFLRLRILEGVPTSWVEPEKVAPFLESGSAPRPGRRVDPDRTRHAPPERARPRAHGLNGP